MAAKKRQPRPKRPPSDFHLVGPAGAWSETGRFPLIELFAGGGGAAYGLSQAGMEPALMVEWDPFAAATLTAAIQEDFLFSGDEVVEQDVDEWLLNMRAYLAGPPFLLWSSFPCSPWSPGGARRGKDDPRNKWPSTLRAIKKLQPRFFVGENVLGLTDAKGRRYLETAILAELRRIYPFVEAWILDAADFGVPQRRVRVFIIASHVPAERPEETHQDPELPRSRRKKGLKRWVTLGEALEHDPWDRLEPMWLGYNESDLEAMKKGTPTWCGHLPGSSGYLTAERATEILETEGQDDWWCWVCKQAISYYATGTNPATGEPWGCRCPGPEEAEEILELPAPTLTGGSERSHTSARSVISASSSKREELLWALTRYHGGISPREAARIGGFPPDWPFQGSNQQIYRQVANSVAPVVAEAIGRSIIRAAINPTSRS